MVIIFSWYKQNLRDILFFLNIKQKSSFQYSPLQKKKN